MLRQMEEGHFIHISDMETEEMPIDEREGSFHIIDNKNSEYFYLICL